MIVGDDVKLTCDDVGNKKAVVVWHFASKVLDETKTRDLVLTPRHQEQGLSLTIRNVSYVDAGVYECIAAAWGDTSAESRVYKKMSTVVVKGKPCVYVCVFTSVKG